MCNDVDSVEATSRESVRGGLEGGDVLMHRPSICILLKFFLRISL